MARARSACTPWTPKYLFNVHLDTVPDSPHWSADPHVMRRLDDRVVGLGVCDIKGAAAALVAAANASDGDAAFLFSSDDEANDPRCIAAFLARGLPYEAVLVAEPTMSEAVLAHRGISSVLMQFAGRAGRPASRTRPPARCTRPCAGATVHWTMWNRWPRPASVG
jgi:acetylornithine deacetylase